MIEERLGPWGRPFTTVMVVLAGLGIMAWACGAIYKTFVGPILGMIGIEPGPDIVAQALALAGLAGFTGIILWLMVYAADRFHGRRFSTRLQEQENQIEQLRTRLAAFEEANGHHNG